MACFFDISLLSFPGLFHFIWLTGYDHQTFSKQGQEDALNPRNSAGLINQQDGKTYKYLQDIGSAKFWERRREMEKKGIKSYDSRFINYR